MRKWGGLDPCAFERPSADKLPIKMEKNRINKDGELVISSTKIRNQKDNTEDALAKLQVCSGPGKSESICKVSVLESSHIFPLLLEYTKKLTFKNDETYQKRQKRAVRLAMEGRCGQHSGPVEEWTICRRKWVEVQKRANRTRLQSTPSPPPVELYGSHRIRNRGVQERLDRAQ